MKIELSEIHQSEPNRRVNGHSRVGDRLEPKN